MGPMSASAKTENAVQADDSAAAALAPKPADWGVNDVDWAAETEARVLAEALRLAPADGWTWRMTYAAGAAAGLSKGETELLLPAGPRDLAALYSRHCDSAAMAELAGLDPKSLKV